jgi:2'-5' RNA ligase
MSPQFNLFGSQDSPAAPRARDKTKVQARAQLAGHYKLFFALRPQADAAQPIAHKSLELDRLHAIQGSLVTADHLHISLHSVGAYATIPPGELDAARRAGGALTSSAFDVVFDQAMSFKQGAYVLFPGEGTQAIQALYLHLGMAMADAGFAIKAANFTPHMTLSYRGKLVDRHSIEPITWTANEVVLINSHQGEGVHEVMGRWPLHAA